MGLPHQIIPLVAVTDLVTATIASLSLGLLPFAYAPDFLREAVAKVSGQTSAWDRLTKSTFEFAVKATSHPPPRKLLFVMFAVCLVRCSSILSVWAGTAKTVANVRAGGRTEDFSGRAIAYSAVCVISMLVNLSMLNLLFQTHHLGHGRPDTSVSGILKQLSPSSLAAEQLMLSAFEWILFVVFLGTNKWLMSSSNSSARQTLPPPIENAEPVSAVKQGGDESSTTNAASTKKDYGSLSQTPQPSAEDNPAAAASSDSVGAAKSTSHETQTVGDVSVDSENVASTSEQQTLAGDATPSDIVDVPSDRKKGMQDAKERLQRARENGKVRRRSLWKKIRGKASVGSDNNVDETNS